MAKNKKSPIAEDKIATQPVVECLGYVHDIDRDIIEAKLRFTVYDGTKREVIIQRASMRTDRTIRDLLDPVGVNYVDADLKTIRAAHKIDIDKTECVVSIPGLRGSGMFAWPGRENKEAGKTLSFRPPSGNQLLHGFQGRQGTIEGWREDACGAAASSSFAIVAAGVVFAGPLLRYSGSKEGAIFAFSGETSTGKTGICLFAQAIMGDPDPAILPSWDATRAGLKDLLEDVREFTLVIDDTSRDGTRTTDRLNFWHDIGHALAGGGRRRVSRAYESQHGAAQTRLPALALTSSEISPDELAKVGGKTVKGGAAVRYINMRVPSPRDGGVYDLAACQIEREGIVDLARETAGKLERGVAANWGLSFPIYLDYLESINGKLPKKVKGIEEGFTDLVQNISPGKATPADLRIAKKFGLVLAGLTLAVKAGAVPFTQEAIEAAVRRCFKAAVGHLDEQAEQRADYIKALRKHLRNDAKVPLLAKGKVPSEFSRGFKRKTSTGLRAYMSFDQIKQALDIWPSDVTDLLTVLLSQGMIIADAEGEKTRPVKVDGRQVRLVVFSSSFLTATPKKGKKAKVGSR